MKIRYDVRMRAYRLPSLACCLLLAFPARAGELRVLVDGASDMPMARIVDSRLTDGVHKRLGEVLAANGTPPE